MVVYEKLIAEMKEQLEYDGYFSGYNVSPNWMPLPQPPKEND